MSDIGELTQEQQKAIKFMVSKGYFSLDSDKFNPHEQLSRYDFTDALVKIFFALDREAQTTFTDVEKTSEHYPYVSSAQQSNIAQGFENNTFRGDLATTKEEVITFCGRTLADKKGYTYPEDTTPYLQFVDNNAISDWARGDVALSVRSSLIDGGGLLKPQTAITRAVGAEILYKLFMLLYDIAPASTTAPHSNNSMPIVAISFIGAVLLSGGGGAFVFLKKRKS